MSGKVRILQSQLKCFYSQGSFSIYLCWKSSDFLFTSRPFLLLLFCYVILCSVFFLFYSILFCSVLVCPVLFSSLSLFSSVRLFCVVFSALYHTIPYHIPLLFYFFQPSIWSSILYSNLYKHSSIAFWLHNLPMTYQIHSFAPKNYNLHFKLFFLLNLSLFGAKEWIRYVIRRLWSQEAMELCLYKFE